MITLIFRKLGIKLNDYNNEQEKGVYFSEFYENTKEFLKDEVGEKDLIMKDKIEEGMDYIMKWWIPKAVKRYKKLLKEKNLQTDTLWYEDINSLKVESWLRSRGINIPLKSS